jgi:vitamin B12 transporter
VKRTLAVILTLALLLPNLALAQGAPTAPPPEAKTEPDAKSPPPEVKVADPVVVTATKVATPMSQLGAAVSIVTEDDVRTYNYSGVEEALRHVPGVDIQRSGGLGKTSSIRIRGANAQQVVVLIDGMRVSSPTLGLTELSELTTGAIDRIEVVRGPQSTLYGADAIGGVVNIITKKGQGPPEGTLWTEGGNYGTIRERANVQGSFGGFNYNLSASRYDTRGQFDNDDSDLTTFNGRVGYDFPWKGELSLTGRYARLNLDLPVFSTTPTTVFDPNAQSESRTYLYNLVYKQPIFDWWDVRLRYGQWWNESHFRNLPPPGSFSTISQIDTRRQEAEILSTFRMGKWNALTLGYENRAEQGYNRGTFGKALETHSGFFEDQLSLFDRLFVTGGLRYESNSAFGDELTPRAGVALVIHETGTKLRATWGKGFRAPTINDLFFPGFGNANLQPEHSESYDAGFDQKLWKNRIRFGSTFFHNRFSNLIQVVFDPATFLAAPFNVGRALSEGVETYVEFEPLDWLLLWANHTWTRSEDLTTGLPLRRFPENQWNGGVTVTPIERLTVFVEARVVGKQFESTTVGRNPGYYRLDFGGTLRLLGRVGALERLDFTARVDNVTDNRYDEVFGFRALGINALVGLRAAFK